MKCQGRDCEKEAIWRVVDRYTQQKQTYTYFYYCCDEHKKQKEHLKTVGHRKTFYRLSNPVTAFKRLAKAAKGNWDGVDAAEYVKELRTP